MSKGKTAKKLISPSPQKTDLQGGNQMAAIAAMHIDFDMMGYYPITPSTEVAETLDGFKAAGLHDIETVFNGDTDSPRPGNEVGGPLEQGQRLLINLCGLLIRCADPLCHQQKRKGADSSFY